MGGSDGSREAGVWLLRYILVLYFDMIPQYYMMYGYEGLSQLCTFWPVMDMLSNFGKSVLVSFLSTCPLGCLTLGQSNK